MSISPLKFWCHKILPLTYDDSLSYYEVLCRVSNKLNETIEFAKDLDEHVKEELGKIVTELNNSMVLFETQSNERISNLLENKTREFNEAISNAINNIDTQYVNAGSMIVRQFADLDNLIELNYVNEADTITIYRLDVSGLGEVATALGESGIYYGIVNGSTLLITNTLDGSSYTYARGANKLYILSTIKNLGVMNDVKRLTARNFTNTNIYTFRATSGLGDVGEGFCVGYIDGDKMYFTNMDTGVCWCLNTKTDEFSKTNTNNGVDDVLTEVEKLIDNELELFRSGVVCRATMNVRQFADLDNLIELNYANETDTSTVYKLDVSGLGEVATELGNSGVYYALVCENNILKIFDLNTDSVYSYEKNSQSVKYVNMVSVAQLSEIPTYIKNRGVYHVYIAVSTSNIKAGSYVCVFDGTNYNLTGQGYSFKYNAVYDSITHNTIHRNNYGLSSIGVSCLTNLTTSDYTVTTIANTDIIPVIGNVSGVPAKLGRCMTYENFLKQIKTDLGL